MSETSDTPRTDEAARLHKLYGPTNEYDGPIIDVMRQLERELAAAIRERDASYAREAGLRKALENLLPFVAAKMEGEEAFIIYQLGKSGISDPRFLAAQAALSTPPPPVVPLNVAEGLADVVEALCRPAEFRERERLKQWATSVLTAYRARQPERKEVGL